MMNALDFVKAFRRMCKEYANCSDCPLYKYDLTCGQILSLSPALNFDIEQLINLVEKWDKEHPVKTRLTEIQKIFPHITADSCPDCLRKEGTRCIGTCKECKEEFWNAEI